MTNEQRVRVDRLERYLITDREKTYTTVRVNDLDTALSLIKEQDKYIKDANDITTEMSNDIKKLTSEIKKKDKQIDLMAISILVKKIGDYPCGYKQDCIKSDKEYRDIHCKDCIKQYFETKAKKGE